jgi:hypothetical protein
MLKDPLTDTPLSDPAPNEEATSFKGEVNFLLPAFKDIDADLSAQSFFMVALTSRLNDFAGALVRSRGGSSLR